MAHTSEVFANGDCIVTYAEAQHNGVCIVV